MGRRMTESSGPREDCRGRATAPVRACRLGLKSGEWVEVKSKAEILSTLDRDARLEALPFMPQMLRYCGRRFRVSKRAHKLCDTVHGTGGRRLSDAVFLEDLRCDGAEYGGCEMRCLVIWKEAWLRLVDGPPGSTVSEDSRAPQGDFLVPEVGGCTEQGVIEGTRDRAASLARSTTVYVCQATQLPHATQPLSRWSPGQYLEDYRSGNARIGEIFAGLLYLVYSELASAGVGFGAAFRWAYNLLQKLRGGTPYPSLPGHLPLNGRTPSASLDLRVGEFVRVKDHGAILDTVDEQLKNRGMGFHPAMVPHCGRTFRVLQRAGKFMNEKTGEIMTLKNECLVLDGADCRGTYSNPILCPRASYPYWREIWLERADGPVDAGD
jgi:hypothetical protein